MLRTSLLIVAILMAGSFVAVILDRSVISVAGSGRPFDHMGDRMKCQLCGADVAVCTEAYNYRCETCGKAFRARWNAADKTIEHDW